MEAEIKCWVDRNMKDISANQQKYRTKQHSESLQNVASFIGHPDAELRLVYVI
jgi:hypothetical protein